MRPIRETNNLFRLTRMGMFNCFLVREKSELTLVDTSVPGSGRAIVRAAKSLGSRINRIVLTHAHFDHVGSLEALAKKLPDAEVCIGEREARLLSGDFSLDPGERGKPLVGFKRASCRINKLLKDGDMVGSLKVVNCPGHTPGQIALLDTRDNSLLAGDSYITQMGVTAAGVFSLLFPLPAWFSWNCEMAVRSAARLSALKPSLLAVGHGRTLPAPSEQMNEAVAVGLRQYPNAR
jgi:glyoxylase-like metal-dependent hydrolase (beta-lactamase superfamily II)